MKFSYLNKRRRKGIVPEVEKVKQDQESGSSGIWQSIIESQLTPTKSGLTPSGGDDKIKSEKEFVELTQEGDFRKFPKAKIKSKSDRQEKLDLKYLNIGYYILIPMVGGIAIGLFLDSQFKSKPLFIGIFLLLGTVAGFYNLFKLIKE